MARRAARRPRQRRRLPVATDRPLTREDCYRLVRPCPFVSCRFHLGIEVQDGEVTIVFPDEEGGVDLEAMADTCVLDVADRSRDVMVVPGGEEAAHAEIGRALRIPASAVKRIELEAQATLKKRLRAALEDEEGFIDLSRSTDTGHNALDYE